MTNFFERADDFALASRLSIDGKNLRIEDVVAVARHRRRVEIADSARLAITRCRALVDVLLGCQEKVYGLTTGFGSLRDVAIPHEQTAQLQKNLLMSHACGVGEPFAEDVVRAAILLRANTLCRGSSGVRVEVVERLVAMLNDDVFPWVPQKGSVGCSGDLAPLSHLALVLIGHPGGLFFPKANRREGSGWVERPRFEDFTPMPTIEDSAATEKVAAEEGWTFRPLDLEAKEGLAVNNGTQFMTAVGVLAVYESWNVLQHAELAAAMSLEAQQGVRAAFDPRIHAARPHGHQAAVAKRVLDWCEGSQLLGLHLSTARLGRVRKMVSESRQDSLLRELDGLIPRQADGGVDGAEIARLAALPGQEQIAYFNKQIAPIRQKLIELLAAASPDDSASWLEILKQVDEIVPSGPLVQDDYSFRCFPQVISCAWRALGHVREILEVEVNSANDNPLLFPPEPADVETWNDISRYTAWLKTVENRQKCRDSVLGGGNFHGEPIAIAMDYLAIAMAEVANIAERRIAHLIDVNHSRGLPPFLIENSGLNSGFMIPQYTAAALVSENKVLCHPASVDSIPTSANSEDHVSMGTIAARKAAEVVENVWQVVAIEMLAAFHGIGLRAPLLPGKRIQSVIERLKNAGIERLEVDRVMYSDILKLLGALGEVIFREISPPPMMPSGIGFPVEQ